MDLKSLNKKGFYALILVGVLTLYLTGCSNAISVTQNSNSPTPSASSAQIGLAQTQTPPTAQNNVSKTPSISPSVTSKISTSTSSKTSAAISLQNITATLDTKNSLIYHIQGSAQSIADC